MIHQRIFWAVCFLTCLLFAKPVNTYAANRLDYQGVFDAAYYYEQNLDLQTTIGLNEDALFQHFVEKGAREGRSGNAEFNLRAYVFHNPDLLNVYKTDLLAYCEHYMSVGKAEGRKALPENDGSGLIGRYSTKYDVTLPRATNVGLAAQRVNGLALQPGQSFSFSQQVLSRIPENGYVLAPAIGRYEYGGGICQVSSTLYAAMCHALMPAVERHPHSQAISYMPVGLDATISEGYKDLKVRNIYQEPLTIVMETTADGVLTASLYLGAGKGMQEAQAVQMQETVQAADNGQNAETQAQTQTAEKPKNIWVQDETGWRVQLADGSYVTDSWYEEPDSKKWYYMGSDGYMWTNMRTPDGCWVNADGVWVTQEELAEQKKCE